MVKKIPLTQGKFALVDDADYEMLMEFNWCANHRGRTWYAACNPHSKGIYMHRLILNTPKGMDTDHINGDGLDNRRCNLRSCSHSGNLQNQQIRDEKKTSKYKGVSFNKRTGKWVAQITVENKYVFIGRFTSELQAALAYDKVAVKHSSEFARTNFPKAPEEVTA